MKTLKELFFGEDQPERQGQFLLESAPNPPPEAPKPGPKPPDSGPKPPETAPALQEAHVPVFVPAAPGSWRIVLRCSLGYLHWAQGLADHLGLTLTRTVQAALSNLAEKHGYREVEPARYHPRRRCRPPDPGDQELPPRVYG